MDNDTGWDAGGGGRFDVQFCFKKTNKKKNTQNKY